jgi:hypothetical protein
MKLRQPWNLDMEQPSVLALHMALDQARRDPNVEAISRSLGLDLADESLWLRIRGQAELNHQRQAAGASDFRVFASLEKGSKVSRHSYIGNAIAAYEAIGRL